MPFVTFEPQWGHNWRTIHSSMLGINWLWPWNKNNLQPNTISITVCNMYNNSGGFVWLLFRFDQCQVTDYIICNFMWLNQKYVWCPIMCKLDHGIIICKYVAHRATIIQSKSGTNNALKEIFQNWTLSTCHTRYTNCNSWSLCVSTEEMQDAKEMQNHCGMYQTE